MSSIDAGVQLTTLEKLNILLEKNMKTKFRMLTSLIIQVVSLVVFIITIRLNPSARGIPDFNELYQAKFASQVVLADVSMLRENLRPGVNISTWTVGYTPSNVIFDKIVNDAATLLAIGKPISFANSKEMQYGIIERKMIAGIEFPEEFRNITQVPKEFAYTLRFPAEFRTFSSRQVQQNIWATHTALNYEVEFKNDDELNLYISEGFLQLQNAIFVAFYQMILRDLKEPASTPTIGVESFSLLTDFNQVHLADIGNPSGFFYYILFLFPCIKLIREICRENAANIILHHTLDGFPNWIHWMAHFLAALIWFFMLDILIVVLLKLNLPSQFGFTNGFQYTDVPTLLLFLLLYNIAAIFFCFAIAIICQKVTIATVVILTIWTTMYSIFAILLEHRNEVDTNTVLISIIFFNNAMAYGIRSVQRLKKDTVAILEYHTEIWGIFAILIFDIFFYLLLLVLADRFNENYYMEEKLHIFKSNTDSEMNRDKRISKKILVHQSHFQKVNENPYSTTFIEAVSCENITKTVRRQTQLRNITLKSYEGEVTVLLGHDKAGITQLLCIVAGFQKLSSGNLYIYGVEQTNSNAKTIRSKLSFCAKDNTLFDELTVSEHIIYWMTLRRVNPSIRPYLMIKWLTILQAHNYATKRIAELSFDKRRLLCLVIALVGPMKIILMDKPTIHMSTIYRRRFWNIVRSHKKNRCFIVSTSSVVEAETVADRIAIFDYGALLAYGSLFFLKLKLSSVYYLICIKKPVCSTSEVTEIVNEFVPDAVLQMETFTQIHYRIASENVDNFANLFRALESRQAELGLASVNIMNNQLSDIYLRISEDSKVGRRLHNRGESILSGILLKSGCDLNLSQIYGMIYKKILFQMPNRVPCILILLSAIMISVLGHMSHCIVIHNILDQEMDIGFQTERKSGAIFYDIITPKYERQYPLAGAFGEMTRFGKKRIYTWRSDSNPFSMNIDEIEKGVAGIFAISLPANINESSGIIFNEKTFHSAPLSLNLLHNVLLRLATKSSSFSVRLTSNPLPIPLGIKFGILEQDLTHMKLPLIIGTIAPFLISSFIFYLVSEHRSNLRCLQQVAGIKIPIYWLIPLLWDFLTVFFVVCVFELAFLSVDIDGYNLSEKIVVFALLLIYGYSALCQTYVFSLFFKSPLLAYLAACLFHMITGLLIFVTYFEIVNGMAILWWFAMFSPDFALLYGISMIFVQAVEKQLCDEEIDITGLGLNEICNQFKECCGDSHWKWDETGILPTLVFLTFTGVTSMFLLLIMEYCRREKKFDTHHIEYLHSGYDANEDIEVLREKQRVNEMSITQIAQYNMVVDQLEDSIPDTGAHLKTVSFAVKSKECVAILAENNTGTTRFLRQLIGEEGFSFGDVYVCGLNIKEDLELCRSMMGYCPMEGSIKPKCSGYELLYLICLIRGVPLEDIGIGIDEIAQIFEMREFLNDKIADLPLHKRRLISLAVAFMVDVKVLLVDQPTAGLPSLTRQIIWGVLRYALLTRKSVVFATTDPWECEAIADRVVVFGDGEMLYYGTLQHLRNKYAAGFMLEVKIKIDGDTREDIKKNLESDITNMKRFVTFMAVDSELRYNHDRVLRFYIPIKTIIWSRVFDLIEMNFERLHIEEYILSQAAFEEILHNVIETRSGGNIE